MQSGVTWPTFHLSGKVLVAIDKFSSLQCGWINDGALSLRILALKPSCPVDQDLTNDISNLLRFYFRYDKTCSGAKPG